MPRLKKNKSLRAKEELPDNDQMLADTNVCLTKAITDRFPIQSSELREDTVPSKLAGADAGAWGMCLATFGKYIRQYRGEVYIFYKHKTNYTVETINKTFPGIVLYLTQKILDQFNGKDK
jgi:hypothetical protein